MLTLQKLKLEGFFGITRAEIPLDKQGLVLVTGTNGAGKTALVIESLYYVLYGHSFEYKKNPGDKVVNWRTGCLLAEIDFEVDGSPYKIRRTRGHPEHGTKLSFWSGEKDVSLGTSAATQSAIEMLLGVGADGFASSAIFSTDLVRFPDFPDAQKKQIMEDLLGVSEADVAMAKVKELRAVRVREKEIADKALSALNTRLTRTQQEIADLSEVVEFSAEDEATLASLQSKLKVAGARLETSKKAAREAAKAKSAVEAQKRTLMAPLTRENHEISTNQRQARNALQTAQRELAEAACPSCTRPWGEEHKQPIREKVQKYTDALADMQTALQEIAGEITILDDRFDAEVRDLAARESAAIKEENQHAAAVAKFTSQISALTSQKARAEGARDQRAVLLGEKIKVKAELEGEIQQHAEDIAALTTELEDYAVLMECFGPKGAKVLVLQNAIPRLNSAAADAAAHIASGIAISFHADSDAGKLEILVDNANGAKQYRGNSAGERRKIDMVVLFALMSLRRIAVNVLSIDEAFEKLAPDAQDEMASYLKVLSGTTSTIFMINHTAGTISQYADQVWEMNRGELVKMAA